MGSHCEHIGLFLGHPSICQKSLGTHNRVVVILGSRRHQGFLAGYYSGFRKNSSNVFIVIFLSLDREVVPFSNRPPQGLLNRFD